MDKNLVESLLKLPVGQRIALAGEIWDSLPDEAVLTSPALKRKLRARLAKIEASPEAHMSLAEFRSRGQDLIKALQKKRRRSA